MIVSVCPPEFAEEIAEQVARQSYQGTFIDANAISPERAQRMAHRFERAARGSLIEASSVPPSTTRNRTWLCLSGDHAASVAPYFQQGLSKSKSWRRHRPRVCIENVFRRLFERLGRAGLRRAGRGPATECLRRSQTAVGSRRPFPFRSGTRDSRAAPKAWRYIGEMPRSRPPSRSAGLPPKFHRAAGEIFRRLEDFKGNEGPGLKDVLGTLLRISKRIGIEVPGLDM